MYSLSFTISSSGKPPSMNYTCVGFVRITHSSYYSRSADMPTKTGAEEEKGFAFPRSIAHAKLLLSYLRSSWVLMKHTRDTPSSLSTVTGCRATYIINALLLYMRSTRLTLGSGFKNARCLMTRRPKQIYKDSIKVWIAYR